MPPEKAREIAIGIWRGNFTKLCSPEKSRNEEEEPWNRWAGNVIGKSVPSGGSGNYLSSEHCTLLSKIGIIISFFLYFPALQEHKLNNMCESNLNSLEVRSYKPKAWYYDFLPEIWHLKQWLKYDDLKLRELMTLFMMIFWLQEPRGI